MTCKSSIFLLAAVALAIGCAKNVEGQNAFFMRFEHPKPEVLSKNIDASYKILDDAKKNRDAELFFQTAIDLGEMLTVARREKEAVEILEPLLKYDLDQAKPDDRAWLYLNYATANQYLQKKDPAGSYFKKALKFVRKHNLENVEHYVLHHYARFLVENRDFDRAGRFFGEALKIRQKLNDARVDSTRKALDELKLLKAAPKNK